MKKLFAIFAFLLLLNSLYAVETNKPQKLCPVLGGEITKSLYVDYHGKRIYFCCSSCVDEFKKDPEKYMKKFKSEGIKLEDSPSKAK